MGKSFMLSFLSSTNRSRQLFVFIFSREVANVTVKVPSLSIQDTYIVDGLKEITLPSKTLIDIEHAELSSMSVLNGITITSDNRVQYLH